MEFDLSLALQIITTLTVVGGFIFGAINLRQYGRERDERAALAAVNALAVDSASHMRRVLTTPVDRPFTDLVASDRALEESAGILCAQYEQLGYLVYRRMVTLSMIDDTVGGSIRASWPRLRPWIEAGRTRAVNPYLEEWFEWLYLELDRYPGKKTAPAASAHLDWRA
ncbi:MAG TPA: hypothetical protein VEU77_13150 [Candidatus Acidoferrales bacterium]|nr:hypothetical protein [Candidatus Acidoferrales bacterium]